MIFVSWDRVAASPVTGGTTHTTCTQRTCLNTFGVGLPHLELSLKLTEHRVNDRMAGTIRQRTPALQNVHFDAAKTTKGNYGAHVCQQPWCLVLDSRPPPPLPPPPLPPPLTHLLLHSPPLSPPSWYPILHRCSPCSGGGRERGREGGSG